MLSEFTTAYNLGIPLEGDVQKGADVSHFCFHILHCDRELSSTTFAAGFGGVVEIFSGRQLVVPVTIVPAITSLTTTSAHLLPALVPVVVCELNPTVSAVSVCRPRLLLTGLLSRVGI